MSSTEVRDQAVGGGLAEPAGRTAADGHAGPPRRRRWRWLVAVVVVVILVATSSVDRGDSLLAAQANPEDPSPVQVSQLSSALLAQAAFNTLFLGLGAVALFVGAIYTHVKGWTTAIPTYAWAGGLAAALVIGALAGLLPTLKAARLSPTRALWTI